MCSISNTITKPDAPSKRKTDIADTDIHITVGQTLSYSDVIEDIISDRVKGMSKIHPQIPCLDGTRETLITDLSGKNF